MMPGLDLSATPSRIQPQMDMQTQQVIIQHVDTINVYITGATDLTQPNSVTPGD